MEPKQKKSVPQIMENLAVDLRSQKRYRLKKLSRHISHNGSWLCVVAISRNLKLTTTLDRAITQSPCYVPFLFRL